MTPRDILVKVRYRVNKAASSDYDNIVNYHVEEATNKRLIEWVRRQIKGKNQTQEGDEETTGRIDDLQVLLKRDELSVKDRKDYVEFKLPTDYLYHKRVTPMCSKVCENVKISSYLKEEGNVDAYKGFPSFEFEETFHTLSDNKGNVYYTDFTINKVGIVYYRKPKRINFKKLDEVIEFKDDVCELFIDDTIALIASDIESLNQSQIAQNRSDTNN